MNPTQDVITDLLPLYFSGEASADTRTLIEEYFAANPEFERMARRMAENFNALRSSPVSNSEELEKRALMRTRTEVRAKNMSLGVVVAGILAIFVMFTSHATGSPIAKDSYPLMVLACVAVLALLVKKTRKTGL